MFNVDEIWKKKNLQIRFVKMTIVLTPASHEVKAGAKRVALVTKGVPRKATATIQSLKS